MALIDDFISTSRGSVARESVARGPVARSFGAEVFQNIGLAVSALAAGWRAAKDYGRLRGTGAFPPEELPREVYRRHFARLDAARKHG